MGKPWWFWIAVIGATVLCLLVGMIRRRIATSGLDEKERAVVHRAARVGGGEQIGQIFGLGVFVASPVHPFVLAQNIRYFKHRAAAKKVMRSNPKKQNRAEGVIFSFYELRITRSELIRGYKENAERIPLQGLTAEVTKTDTVDIAVKGPDTKFVYSMPYDVVAGFNARRARQFAALLNYEASLQGAPPDNVEKLPATSGAAETEARGKSTKVRCLHCQHVQTVPVSQETFACEQCKAHLKRRTAPAKSS